MFFQVYEFKDQQTVLVGIYQNFDEATSCAEAISPSASGVWIESIMGPNHHLKKPIASCGFRFDKEVNAWIETSLPVDLEEFHKYQH